MQDGLKENDQVGGSDMPQLRLSRSSSTLSSEEKKQAKTSHYADAWGIRKLISHCLRNLRLERIPRAPCWCNHCYFFRIISVSLGIVFTVLFVDVPHLVGLLSPAETPATRLLMKVFLDAWFPGSWSQLELAESQEGEDWGAKTLKVISPNFDKR